jgi:hypothetical protein
MEVELDGSAETWRIPASCTWVKVQDRPVMLEVGGAFTFDGTLVNIDLGRRALGDADLPDLFATVNTSDGGLDITYVVFPVGLATGQGAGELRFLRGQPHAGIPVEQSDALRAGTIRWQCGSPDQAAPEAPPGYGPHERVIRTGTAHIHLGAPIGEDLEATASCRLHSFPVGDGESSDGPPEIVDTTLEALFRGEHLIITSLDSDALTLERLGVDDRILGEYVSGGAGPIYAIDPDQPFDANLGQFVFEPTDPRYQPFGGPSGPRAIEISVSVDCSS